MKSQSWHLRFSASRTAGRPISAIPSAESRHRARIIAVDLVLRGFRLVWLRDRRLSSCTGFELLHTA